jgi:hypothetical protein
MGKNLYERRKIREAKKALLPPPVRSLKWHERNVIKQAENFSRVFVTTVGFGVPLARAGNLLNEAVERMHAARANAHNGI